MLYIITVLLVTEWYVMRRKIKQGRTEGVLGAVTEKDASEGDIWKIT